MTIAAAILDRGARRATYRALPARQRAGRNVGHPTMIEYFDRNGRATAFCDYGKDVYLWDGHPAAFIHDETVFAYSGRAIGWISDGWICDLVGARLLFEYDAVGGPSKPDRQKRAPLGTRGQKPQKQAREEPGPRAAISQNWSDRTFAELI